jgi:hypothetical protein
MGKEDLEAVSEIVVVEEPLYIRIGRFLIRNTLDALVRYRETGEMMIRDHKTGDPAASKEWLPLDIQTGCYYVTVRGHYGKPLAFEHTFIAREVPPGFGHRPLTTESGKKRSNTTLESMLDSRRYLQRVFTPLSNEVLDAYTNEIRDLVLEIEHALERDRWPRTPIKTGPFACSNCAYFDVCKAERSGKEIGFTADIMFITRESEEWRDLESGKLALELK